MNRLKYFLTFLVVFFIFLFFLPRQAQAYIDPGTGSYVVQIILAFILGGVFTLKLYWKKITKFLRKLFSKSTNTKDEE
ncbi:hypothetical protein A2Z22_00240 [Candidatus Woesebacteria bacterium RBG_16_34_12]|uniref:Uncharacterized protein n=1 Tax=Candidatus Woesebacteria bacterium RBG_16_34_12 TaxID=1802480 RepID=A0A1F7XAT8_9BACT|nr:MAG: hypothetical protein A2Z22_00240 [Candidatus Woesebacteria bacterium RBG_16_34_12]